MNKFELIVKGCHRVMAVRPVLCTPPRRVTPREMLLDELFLETCRHIQCIQDKPWWMTKMRKEPDEWRSLFGQ